MSDFPFPSVSACPSLASSPVVARRDSILKHSGSVKNTDRRVSIKQNQPIIVEYLSEKRQTVHQQPSNLQDSSNVGKSNSRPASLILTRGDRPTLKLIRTPSFDQDQDDANATNFTDFEPNQPNQQSNDHPLASHLPELHLKDDDEEDESVPLVQNANKEPTKITSSTNHT